MHLSTLVTSLPHLYQVGRCLFIVENALAVIVMHFLRHLPRPFPVAASSVHYGGEVGGDGGEADSAANRLLEDAAASLDIYNLSPPTEADAARLGSTADLAYFMTKLQVHDNQ